MKNEDEQLDLLIERLRNETPTLNNAAELTDSIVNRVVQPPAKKTPALLIAFRTVSVVAAALLLLFLLQEQTTETYRPGNKHLYCFTVKHPANQSHTDKLKSYLSHLRENTNKTERLKSLLNP